MGMGKKLAIGALCLLPAIALVVGIWGLLQDSDEGVAIGYTAIFLGGILDLAVAAWFIPHVHDNRRVGSGARLIWIVLLGLPYITIAPIYWVIHVLPEKPGDQEPAHSVGAGGAWYADPWGEAPYRWWDGNGWTDWVTGPPG